MAPAGTSHLLSTLRPPRLSPASREDASGKPRGRLCSGAFWEGSPHPALGLEGESALSSDVIVIKSSVCGCALIPLSSVHPSGNLGDRGVTSGSSCSKLPVKEGITAGFDAMPLSNPSRGQIPL